MGIAFVLVFWAVIGAIVSTLGALMLSILTHLLARGALARGLLLITSAVLPFLSCIWVGGVLFAAGMTRSILFGRDIGFGDGWVCPVTNGYSLVMIDVLEYGILGDGKVSDSGIFDVQQIAVSGDTILGKVEPRPFPNEVTARPPYWFVLDTRKKALQKFSSEQEFASAANALHIAPTLRSVGSFYTDSEPKILSYLILPLCLVPPILAHAALACGVWLSRRYIPKPAPYITLGLA